MMHTYEAILSQADSIASVQAARRVIERAGGQVKIAPPSPNGMVLVTLLLPDHLTPQQFLPGLPFYRV